MSAGLPESKFPEIRSSENSIDMFWLGTIESLKYREHTESGDLLPGLHNPGYYPDFDISFESGVAATSRVVIDLSNRQIRLPGRPVRPPCKVFSAGLLSWI